MCEDPIEGGVDGGCVCLRKLKFESSRRAPNMVVFEILLLDLVGLDTLLAIIAFIS